MVVDDGEGVHEALEQENYNRVIMDARRAIAIKEEKDRPIKEALGSIWWGLSSFAIGGGLWLALYEDWLPQGLASVLTENQAGSFLAMGAGLALALYGFLSLRVHRTGTARAHGRLASFTLVIHSIALFIGAVLAATLITISIILPLGDERFLFMIFGVVLTVMALAVTVSYFWSRAWNSTEPAPIFRARRLVSGHRFFRQSGSKSSSAVGLRVHRLCAPDRGRCLR
jgi:hypothetical protein